MPIPHEYNTLSTIIIIEKSKNNNRILSISQKKSIFAVFKQIGRPFVYHKEKDIICILACNSADFAGLYCIIFSIGLLFATVYGLNELTVGLTFLSPGFGTFLGSHVSGKTIKLEIQAAGKRNGSNGIKKKLSGTKYFY